MGKTCCSMLRSVRLGFSAKLREAVIHISFSGLLFEIFNLPLHYTKEKTANDYTNKKKKSTSFFLY
jgi:hypothetical protein